MKKQSKIYIEAFIFAMLLPILACVFPGLATPRPAPVIGADTLSAMVASTAANLMTQTAMAGAESAALLDTPAPQFPTETSTPTATNTPKISGAGTSLLVLADGSTQFTDHRAGIQLVIPPGWLTVRVNEEEYYRAWESEWASNGAVSGELGSFQNLDPQVFRLHALDVRPEHIINGAVTKINVVFRQDDPRTLSELAKDEKNPKPYVGYKLVSSSFVEKPGGLQTFIIIEQWKSVSFTNQEYSTYYKRVLFKVPNGSVFFDFWTLLGFEHIVLPEFDQLVDNVVLLNP